jgi:hypothetical protein
VWVTGTLYSPDSDAITDLDGAQAVKNITTAATTCAVSRPVRVRRSSCLYCYADSHTMHSHLAPHTSIEICEPIVSTTYHIYESRGYPTILEPPNAVTNLQCKPWHPPRMQSCRQMQLNRARQPINALLSLVLDQMPHDTSRLRA